MSKRVSVKMPERPKPDAAALDAFVRQGAEDVPAPARVPAKPAETVRLNLNMPQELHRRFKTVCAAKGVTISEVVTELVQGWTAKNS